MTEESGSPNIDRAAQSTPSASLNDTIAPETENKINLLQRFGSLFRGNRSKIAAEPEENPMVAQLRKDLEQCRKERDRCKDAHLTSEEEKKLKATEIDNLKEELRTKDSRIAKMENKITTCLAEIEELKITHANTETDWKTRIDNMQSKEIEYLQKIEGQWKSGISQLEKAVEAAKNVISEDVARGFATTEDSLMNLLDRPTEKTMRWRFTDIKNLTEVPAHSLPTEFAGITWMIGVLNKDGHLGVLLWANKVGAANWSAAVIADFQLLSQKDNSIVKRHASPRPNLYCKPWHAFGNAKFMLFEDLFKGEGSDAVKGNSILVAVDIKVFPSD